MRRAGLVAGHVACERWGTFCTAESGTPRAGGPKNKLTIFGGLEKYKERWREK